MTSLNNTFLTLVACTILSACGGGGGGDDGPRTVFTNQPLNSRVPGESTIAAAGIVQDPTDSGGARAVSVQVITGSLDRPTQDLDIGELIRNGERVADNTWRSDGAFIEPTTNPAFASSNFAFLVPVDVTQTPEDPTVDPAPAGNYIVGVAARTQDLPNSGSLTFSGPASVTQTLNINGAEGGQDTGTAAITASFGSDNTVDVVIDRFENGTLSFDVLEINDLRISTSTIATFESTNGSSFNTGSDTVFEGGAELSASGALFGGDSNGPAEAGGAFLIKGNDNAGEVFGVFAGN